MPRDIYWSKDKKQLRLIKLWGMLVVPVVLYFIPLEWLKDQHSICLFKNITGHECYGCGMTRAIISAIHLQFANAFQYNKLFLIVLPLLIYVWGKNLVNLWPGKTVT
jgi:Protein of unknown function (DUF2752)